MKWTMCTLLLIAAALLGGAMVFLSSFQVGYQLHEEVDRGPLLHALIEKDARLDRIEQQLKRNPKAVDASDVFGRTPLHLAAAKGSAPLVLMLIAYGADINAEAKGDWGFEGWTALHFAAHGGHVHLVQLLVNHGAELDAAKSQADFTPLELAEIRGHPSVVEYLRAKGEAGEGAGGS